MTGINFGRRPRGGTPAPAATYATVGDSLYAFETGSDYWMDAKGRPWGRITRPVIDTLFFWRDNHCRSAFESERAMRGLPPEMRSTKE